MSRNSLTTVTLSIAALLLTAACSARPADSGQPTPSASTAASPTVRASTDASVGPTASRPAASPTVTASSVPVVAPTASLPQCRDFFTPPPYDAFQPVPGVSVRVIDKGHFEVVNASRQSYFGKVFTWATEDDLVCGRGVIGHDSGLGRVAPGATVEWLGGTTPDIPMTVELWDSPCGEGCYRTPIGAYVVPISSVEPVPVAT